MAITGALTIIDTDFSDGLGGIVSACSPNVLRVTATLTGGTDTGAYVEMYVDTYYFRMINKTFDGTSGEFYFDFTEILPYLFDDISDDVLSSGVQIVGDTFVNSNAFDIILYNSLGDDLDVISIEHKLIFSSKQIGNPNGSNEVEIFAHQMPNFLAQKNKQSYIYHYGEGQITFEKVSHIPEQIYMIDNLDRIMVDNLGNGMVVEI